MSRYILFNLSSYDIRAERKTVYEDIRVLNENGFEILSENGKHRHADRFFELPEIKLLVDSIQASRFVSEEQTHSLIKKLEKLCSKNEAKQLTRQVHIANRAKSNNNSVFINVDTIHHAISSNRQISFRYFNLDHQKEKVYRRNGEPYIVSPYALIYTDELYYLVAFDNARGRILHLRVDRMETSQIIESSPRIMSEEFKEKRICPHTQNARFRCLKEV